MSETKAKKSELQEQAAAAQSELGETEKTKAADEAFLKALTTDCKATAHDWEMRQADAAAEKPTTTLADDAGEADDERRPSARSFSRFWACRPRHSTCCSS